MKIKMQICRFSILKTITAKIFLTFAVIFISQQMFAQFVDDFSDGNFTANPTWTGNESKFIVANQELKLQAPPIADNAYLAVPSTSINHASWEFVIKMEFNPSSTNYAKIYLVADRPELTEPLNGYFVLVGNSSDEVSLYKQTGITQTKIIDGVDQRINLSSVAARIKVTRDEHGFWDLMTDVGLTDSYTSEGNVTDTTHPSTHFFGIVCHYSSTRSDKFYFDDFIVSGDPFIDIIPPEVTSVEVTSANTLVVTFSETLEEQTSKDISNYLADYHLGHPEKATLLGNKKEVELLFHRKFSSGVLHTLTVVGVQDVARNTINTTSLDFLFIQPASTVFKDIIFTEIMADPVPRVGLPELEFVEIFNRSEKAFDLSGWQFHDLSASIVLPRLIILPGEYIILSPSADEFTTYGKVWGASNFPTLNNASDLLMLKDSNGSLIDSVVYTDGWYRNNEKRNGGWSLELIDPENLCSERENWIASEAPAGGTPGKQNSVFANKPDLTGPALLSAIPLSSSLIELTFNEKLEKALPLLNSFQIEPSIKINNVAFGDASLSTLQLSLTDELHIGTEYTITVNTVYDCAGNLILNESNKASFGLPEPIEPADLIINEILFNPRPTGVDFVEIVNKSTKYINLKNYTIANISEEQPRNNRLITRDNFLFKPGDYLVVTTDVNIVKGEYPNLREENVLVVDVLPGFNDKQGSVAIVDADQNLIDHFIYTSEMHSIFIKDEEGVSLERLSFHRPSNEIQNWKSASSLEGYATPGYLNSNNKSDLALTEESVQVDPEIFIPVNGQPDFTSIHYKFDNGGYVANIKIFDEKGHLIKRLANNEILGTQGVLRWDGDRDDGRKTRMGYYMIWFEVFDTNGMVQTFRKRVAISAGF